MIRAMSLQVCFGSILLFIARFRFRLRDMNPPSKLATISVKRNRETVKEQRTAQRTVLVGGQVR